MKNHTHKIRLLIFIAVLLSRNIRSRGKVRKLIAHGNFPSFTLLGLDCATSVNLSK